MSFVFGKSKKGSYGDAVEQYPGPADYLHIQKAQPQGTAPFNSSAFKKSTFDMVTSTAGPGSYNPPCQRQLQADKRMRMTSNFSSKVERFKTEPSNNSQEKTGHMQVSLVTDSARRYTTDHTELKGQKELYGEVVNRAKMKINLLQEANGKRRMSSIGGNREFVRVVLVNPKNTEAMHSVFIDGSVTKKENGPGSYNIASSTDLGKRNVHVVDWSRNTAKRFKQHKAKTPGPGAYQSKTLQRMSSCLSASFAYQGLRSHMDEVIYKTKMPFKVKVIQQKKLRDRYPGPGHYNPSKVATKSFNYGDDCFGSTLMPEGKQLVQEEATVPGPGHYVLREKQDMKERVKKTREKIFGKGKMKTEKVETLCDQNKEEVRRQAILEMQRMANKFYSLKERCQSKVGDFSHAERWRGGKDTSPGPGDYYFHKENTQFLNERAVYHAFNSTSQDRASFIQDSLNTPFYDVDRNDMGKRAIRIRRNIENLRQIDIEKAPFNARQQRFVTMNRSERKHSEGNTSPQVATWNTQNNGQREARYHMMKKAIMQEQQPSASFKSNTKRSQGIPKDFVGPGNYEYPSSLEKKSFNQGYNYKPPSKIRGTYRAHSSLS